MSLPKPEKNKSHDSPAPSNIERRILAVDDIELRVIDDDNPKIAGYAAKFNKWSDDLGGFREKIAPAAFDDALKNCDVRGLKNHDVNLLLGRTSSGTLRLVENTIGLKFECDVPDTTTGRDVTEEIRRKDITGCSFAFTVASDKWKYNEDDTVERIITKFDKLFDVGPVTYPAYPDTTVATRSLEKFKEDTSQRQDESKEIENERLKVIEKGYRKAGRIINRIESAKV